MPLTFRNGNEADLDISKLMAAEPAFCTDTKKMYIGNGDGTAYPVMTAGMYSLGTGANNPNTVDHALYADNYPDWMSIPYTCTYASATSFTVPANLTGILSIGDKLKIIQPSGIKYLYAIGVSVSNGTTTVTTLGGINYSLDNAAISAAYMSKVGTPVGWPMLHNWNAQYFTVGSVGAIGSADGATDFWIHGHQVQVKISAAVTLTGTSVPVGIYVSLPLVAGTIYCAMTAWVKAGGVFLPARGGLMETTDKAAILSSDLQIGTNVIAISGFYRYA